MNLLRCAFGGLLIILSARPLQAQSLMIIDGTCQVPLSTSSINPAVTIDPTSGNLLVTSNGGFNCGGAAVTLAAPALVPANAQFEISWSSTGTTGCTTSGGGNTGWAGAGRPSSGSLQLIAPATTQTIQFDISCATGGAQVTDSASVLVEAEGMVDLILPTSAMVNAVFSVSWSSTGTTGCTPTGGAGTNWASLGTLPTSGNQQLTAPSAAASNVVFGITCSRTGGGTASDSEFMQFLGESPCSGVSLPPGINSMFQQNWSTAYGAQFPLNYSTNRIFSIGTGTGLRIAITPTVPQGGNGNGTVTFNEWGNEARAGFMTISECPGDFRLDALNVPVGCTANCSNRCHTGVEAASNLNLAFRTTNHANNACNLVEGRPYFINIHFGSTSTPAADGSYCSGPVCSIIGGTQSLFLRETHALKWLDSGDLIGLQPPASVLSVKLDTSAQPQ